MTNQYPPPPPGGYPVQQQQAYPQQQPQQSMQGSGWVDNSQYLGGWHAAQNGLQTGKYVEYKVTQRPTAKGSIFKQVKFFRPYQTKNGQMREGDSFSFNQIKELVDRINHFQNSFGEEKGYFVWQPANPMLAGVGQPAAPVQQQMYPMQQPQYQQPQQVYAAPLQQQSPPGVLPPPGQWDQPVAQPQPLQPMPAPKPWP